MTETGRTRRARRIVALPLAGLLLAAGATAVLARPSTPAAGAVASAAAGDFTLTSEVLATASGAYPAASCSGTDALLAPGTTRCVVFTVHNTLASPITVTSITSALAASSSTLPAECVGDNLTLPVFSGAFTVPAGGTGTSLGVPLELRDSGTNQDACQGVTYDFVYTATAQVAAGSLPLGVVLAQGSTTSALGSPVGLTATVGVTPGAGTPTGQVTFFVETLLSGARSLGTATVDANGVAQLSVSALPEGTDRVYAVYGGDATFGAATSAGLVHTVVRAPARCTGTFPTTILGDPLHPVVAGTTGRDLVLGLGGAFTVRGNGGDDCLVVGDGRQSVTGGAGNDVVIAGKGAKTVAVGGGNNTLLLGSGVAHVSAGNGANNLTLRGATGSLVRLGSGPNTVNVVGGNHLTIYLGHGRNVVRLTGRADHVVIRAGRGRNVVYLGSGRYNLFVGMGTGNICHVPRPPRTWHGTLAAYYRDRVVNCRLVTP